MFKVIDARYLRDYVLRLKFNDGIEGEVDLKNELHGEILLPLKDKTTSRNLFSILIGLR